MFFRPVQKLLLVALTVLVDPTLGPAKGPRNKPGRGYVPIPFEGNLEDMLRRQFHKGKLNDLNDLIKKLPIDFKKFKIDAKSLTAEKMDWRHKEKIQELLKSFPRKELPPQELEKLKEMDKILKEIPSPPGKKTFPTQDTTQSNPPEENLENKLSRWAVDLMKNAEDSNLGDMLRDSPAWREGLKDFENFLSGQEGNFDFPGPGKWNLPLPKKLNIDLGQSWEKIKNLSLPQLPSVHLPMPDLGIGNPLAGLKLPSFPSGSLAISQALVWVLVAIGLVLVVRQMVRRVGKAGQAISGWRLGPWPVDPARISNRAELIAAFEHLALLCVGRQARTWNHHAIGEELSKNEERRRAALELAALYEWARYAPEPDELSDQALATARRDLCFLAGVAAP